MGSNPAPSTNFFFSFFLLFLSFSPSLDGFGSNLTPCNYTPPFFMILIIPNIVQNLYLHLSMTFILGLHPPYPTSPTYPKPCYPTSPTPTPDRTPPPPQKKKYIFFEFSQKLQNFNSPFPSTLTPPPPTTQPNP